MKPDFQTPKVEDMYIFQKEIIEAALAIINEHRRKQRKQDLFIWLVAMVTFIGGFSLYAWITS